MYGVKLPADFIGIPHQLNRLDYCLLFSLTFLIDFFRYQLLEMTLQFLPDFLMNFCSFYMRANLIKIRAKIRILQIFIHPCPSPITRSTAVRNNDHSRCFSPS